MTYIDDLQRQIHVLKMVSIRLNKTKQEELHNLETLRKISQDKWDFLFLLSKTAHQQYKYVSYAIHAIDSEYSKLDTNKLNEKNYNKVQFSHYQVLQQLYELPSPTIEIGKPV